VGCREWLYSAPAQIKYNGSFLVPTRRRPVFFLVPTRRRGNPFGTRRRPVFFWFPRAGVGTHSGRAGVPSFIYRSHAPLLERIIEVTAKRATSPQRRDAFATQIGSHAGAWEPEKPAKTGRICYPNRFPRRRVGTRKLSFWYFQ